MCDNSVVAEPAGADRSALLIVDVQNDFCTGGALAVPGSEPVVDALNRYIDDAAARGMPIYASRDWHPAVTKHFTQYGGPWPVHCVQGTDGARFRGNLHLPPSAVVVTKGDDAEDHGYSALEGHTQDRTPFLADLQRAGITHLYVGGLATDYCVKHSVLDARAAGFAVTVLDDAIAGVDLAPGDSAQAIAQMRQRGATFAALNGSLAR
jgi:nicotinamidase/pyrazinamidase